jgi:hypothetical protein
MLHAYLPGSFRFSYVAGALISTVFVLVGQVVVVGKLRKASGIKYPQREHHTLGRMADNLMI